MHVLKRIKWPGWAVIVLVMIIFITGIYQFLHTKVEAVNKTEVVAEVKNLPATIINNQTEKKYPRVEAEQLLSNKIAMKQKILNELDPNGKYIALTFDDGPSAAVTPRILATLQEFGAKATFFVLGEQVERHPELARQIVEKGHEIGNHSYSHANLTKLEEEAVIRQFEQTNTIIEQVTSVKPTLLRPPYGAFNDKVAAFANNKNYSIILWSVDSLDWKSHSAPSVYQTVIGTVTNRAIVLLHDIHSATADALPQMLTELKKEGYEFLTVTELLTLQEETGSGPFYGRVK